MILKIAWRNLWRNKRRTLIALSSVIVGVIAAILLDGLTTGMLNQMLFNQINTGVSHIQIHNKGFRDNINVKNVIPDYKKVIESVKNNQSVNHYSKRVVTFGLLSSASNSSGVYINGVEPEAERNISIIYESLKEGSYLSSGMKDIVIGKSLAERLGIGLGGKVVAMANTPDGSVSSEVFRVSGIFETYSSEFDRINIYINITAAQKMLNISDNIHEIAIITKDDKEVTSVKSKLAESIGSDYEVLSYIDLLPLLVMISDLYKQEIWIINLIVGLALIFGIINVMLMAVFERIREFGVLRSIGLNSAKLFLMILTESISIGAMGTVIGIILAIVIQIPLSEIGIDLSMFAEGLRSFGVGAVIYPSTSMENLISLLVLIPFVSVVAALYPAYKAIKLEPVYAIRHV